MARRDKLFASSDLMRFLRPLSRLPDLSSRKSRTNAVLGLMAVAIATVYWLLIPYGVQLEHAAMGITGRFFPRMAALIVGVSGALLFLRSLFIHNTESVIDDGIDGLKLDALRRISPYLCVTVVYVALIDPVGYLTTTIIAVAALLWLAGERRVWLLTLISVAVSVGLYALFQYVMQVPLPEGILL